ncbi:MAG: RNA polymerase sigma factor [Pseudomonadota bacterium]|nr:RNA polymerase sigma factor [Pseudomonadota bacterium]
MFSDAQLNGLYRYGISLTNDETLAYDLLQDAIECYLKMDPARRPVDGAGFYLRRVMRNRYIDQLRKEKRYPHESLEDGGDSLVSMAMPDPGELVIDRQMIESILARLDPLERELLHLWAYEEMTAREIATQLDSPRGTILSRIHRLKKKIARFDLGGDGIREGAGT